MVVISKSNDPNSQNRVSIGFHHIAQTGKLDSRTQWREHSSQRPLSGGICFGKLADTSNEKMVRRV